MKFRNDSANTNKLEVTEVIKQRLNLQSVNRRISDNYKITAPSLDKFTKSDFLRQFNSWADDRKTSFLIELGGPTNIKRTRNWIFNLINKSKEN